MSWTVFYLSCFSVGLVLCLLSALTGGHAHTHVAAQAPGHVRVPHGAGARCTQHHAAVSAINGFTLTAFLAWFGGTGYLLHVHAGLLAWLTLLLSSVSGLVGACVIFWFLSAVLMPHDRSLTAEETAITGVVGRVSDPLQPGCTGEILYSQLGVRRSSPARSADGTAILRDAEVIVLRYEQGIAYVRPWNEFET